jgi:hypothetical protein
VSRYSHGAGPGPACVPIVGHEVRHRYRTDPRRSCSGTACRPTRSELSEAQAQGITDRSRPFSYCSRTSPGSQASFVGALLRSRHRVCSRAGQRVVGDVAADWLLVDLGADRRRPSAYSAHPLRLSHLSRPGTGGAVRRATLVRCKRGKPTCFVGTALAAFSLGSGVTAKGSLPWISTGGGIPGRVEKEIAS